MIYYGNDNTVINTEGFRYVNRGMKACIYEKDGLVFKKFNTDTQPKYILKKKVFKKLKSLDIPHFITLDNYYYQFKGLNELLCIDAYTYKYIDQDNTTLLFQDKEYILEMVNELTKAIDCFTKNGIGLFDCHSGNIIFSENDVTIIDPDMFYLSKMPSRILNRKNKIKLLNYIKSTLNSNIEKYCDSSYYYNYAKLFDFKVNSDTDIVKELDSKIKEKTIYNSLRNK